MFAGTKGGRTEGPPVKSLVTSIPGSALRGRSPAISRRKTEYIRKAQASPGERCVGASAVFSALRIRNESCPGTVNAP